VVLIGERCGEVTDVVTSGSTVNMHACMEHVCMGVCKSVCVCAFVYVNVCVCMCVREYASLVMSVQFTQKCS